MNRIGLGTDIHALVKGRPLILGGVRIPYARGLKGHSDADALLHAVTDAILGAMGAGDIGDHFPDTDPAHRGADSVKLLRAVLVKMSRQGWKVENCDTVIHAQRPKLGERKDAIRRKLAEVLGIKGGRVNVKAKSGEGFDAVGRGEAIAAQAVVLLSKKRRGTGSVKGRKIK